MFNFTNHLFVLCILYINDNDAIKNDVYLNNFK